MDGLSVSLVAIVLLLIANAFFVAAELALVKANGVRIVVGEQVPRTFAIRQPEPVSLFIAYPLRGFYLLAFSLNWLLNRASGGILRVFGVEEATHGDVMTSDELKDLIGVSEEHGHLYSSLMHRPR